MEGYIDNAQSTPGSVVLEYDTDQQYGEAERDSGRCCIHDMGPRASVNCSCYVECGQSVIANPVLPCLVA